MIDVSLLTQKEVSETVSFHCLFFYARTFSVYKNHSPLLYLVDSESSPEESDLILTDPILSGRTVDELSRGPSI